MVGADGEVGRRRPRLDLLVRAIEEWELLLIPILFVLVIAVYANRSTVLTIVSSALLMAYAVGLISGVIIDLVNDPGTWRSVTQAILLPIALTVGTLPYIQLSVLVERFRFSRGAKCKMVTSSEYGKDWPLIVDSARLCCRFRAVWVEVNGKKYGVYEQATSTAAEGQSRFLSP